MEKRKSFADKIAYFASPFPTLVAMIWAGFGILELWHPSTFGLFIYITMVIFLVMMWGATNRLTDRIFKHWGDTIKTLGKAIAALKKQNDGNKETTNEN